MSKAGNDWKEQQSFKTTNLNLAAALVVLEYDLARVIMHPDGFATFVFLYDKHIQKAVDMYWSGALEVPALDYANAIKNLKARLHSTL